MATREDDQAPSGNVVHYAAVINSRERPISPRYLSEAERLAIADLHRQGHSGRAIAVALGRSPSTISRELRRNASPLTGHYRPFEAQKLAVARRARPGRGRLLRDSELRSCVEESLACRWSPAQMSVQLRQRFPGQRDRHLAAESIYRPELGGWPAASRSRCGPGAEYAGGVARTAAGKAG